MKKILFIFALSLSFFTIAVSAQPRPVDKNADEKVIPPAPASFEAKYEGGMLGYSKKEKGTLKFDDVNERIVFYGKDNKEVFQSLTIRCWRFRRNLNPFVRRRELLSAQFRFRARDLPECLSRKNAAI